jgi:RimJ/RimL family protein N-acetyltransferase
MPSRLETARLTLRPWSDSDAEGHSALFAERGEGPLPVERSREIAYELFRSAHGHGYATEAACAVLAAASTTGRGRVWATVRTWNAPSFRVLEKLGFERDHVSADDRGELVWLTRALPRARRSA